MKNSMVKIKKLRTFICILTSAAFLLLSAYHTYLYFEIPVSRPGRLLGIISFVCLAAASAFTLISKPVFRALRTVLMISGLALNFSIKLLNAPGIFGSLDFNNILTVLNCGIYVFSQLAELLLLIYYLTFRHNQRLNSNRKAVIVMMSIVIALYLACFVMECILIIKYRRNIDLGIKLTLLSRFLYFAGYAGIAVNFMLPVQAIAEPEDFMHQPPSDSDLMFSDAENDTDNVLPEGYDDNLMFSHSVNDTDNALPEGYDDLLITRSANDTDGVLPKGYANDLMFSHSENDTDNALPEGYDDDFVM